MTVAELIEHLSRLPQDYNVRTYVVDPDDEELYYDILEPSDIVVDSDSREVWM